MNGGYIAYFGTDSKVKFSKKTSELSLACDNVLVVTVWDACAIKEKLGGRGNGNFNFRNEAPFATYKTVTLSACRLG